MGEAAKSLPEHSEMVFVLTWTIDSLEFFPGGQGVESTVFTFRGGQDRKVARLALVGHPERVGPVARECATDLAQRRSGLRA